MVKLRGAMECKACKTLKTITDQTNKHTGNNGESLLINTARSLKMLSKGFSIGDAVFFCFFSYKN